MYDSGSLITVESMTTVLVIVSMIGLIRSVLHPMGVLLKMMAKLHY